MIGCETEYGVISHTQPRANPSILSAHIVTGYARLHEHLVGWDYAHEVPLADARGWEIDRDAAHPSQLTDVEPLFISTGDPSHTGEGTPLVYNMVTGNGARLYVDHAHPEYSAPETGSAKAAVLYDLAGDVIMREAQHSHAAGGAHPFSCTAITPTAGSPMAPMKTICCPVRCLLTILFAG